MNESRLKEYAELMLLGSLIKMISPKVPKNSRLYNRYRKLLKYSAKYVDKQYVDRHIDFVKEKIGKFGESTGWENQERHVVTYVSFLCVMFDESKYSDVFDTLNDIYDYFERGRRVRSASHWAGELAYQKWQDVWK